MYTREPTVVGGEYSTKQLAYEVDETGLADCYYGTDVATNLSTTANIPHCWIIEYSGAPAHEIRIYRDGSEMVPSPVVQAQSPPTGFGLSVIRIGSTDVSAPLAQGSFLVGRWSASIVMDLTRTEDERAQLFQWARWRYGTP